ncbi:MAG: hypothetical protein HWD58_05110 [Bacteroidota bacterium]|nr:MAG: hypothetical protein HWD58_05110 [Bacteroidota bacterium]
MAGAFVLNESIGKFYLQMHAKVVLPVRVVVGHQTKPDKEIFHSRLVGLSNVVDRGGIDRQKFRFKGLKLFHMTNTLIKVVLSF